jgi:hypothetical protein
MTVYVDNMRMQADVPNGKRIVSARWSHMVADTREELDRMADHLGLKRTWIQCSGTWKEHYDVTDSKRTAALELGAVELRLGPDWKAFMEARKRANPSRALNRAGQSATDPHPGGPGASRAKGHRSTQPVLEWFEDH